MQPIVNELEEEFAGQVAFYRLNVEEPEQARVQQEYGLRGHPSVLVLDGDGQPNAQFVGVVEVERLQEALTAVIP
ncbi:MAG: hypothetical protein KC423_29585, partial [Anaerolineales bacterium]|nr:hypothetical protein [Anaerolineales bacterium]